ncbi:MAG: protoporphyrinogen oxidase HemJ [Rhodospirillaceae bacterium]|nr:MAG: protoporphyrinogen oxidase HemJ [Rhodospirillaceae bacterium]
MFQSMKTLHIVAVIAWMAGLLYLPRLFVYHADADVGSDKSETFKVMERRLLRTIINPAMGVTWLAGLGMVVYWELNGITSAREFWFVAKFILVIVLSGMSGVQSRYVRQFAADANTRPSRFYRIFNEVPFILIILIVALVVIKPFQGLI